jgi:hypothetical protein
MIEMFSHQVSDNASVFSPFNTSSLAMGENNHLSTVGLVYTENTFPTPWPILIINIAVSIVTGGFGVISDFRLVTQKAKKERSMGLISVIITIACVAYQTIRCISEFYNSIKAFRRENGKFASGLSTAGLILSLYPYLTPTWMVLPDISTRTKNFWSIVQIIAYIDSFIALTVTAMVFGAYLRPSALYYGKTFLSGGNCPFVVTSCSSLPQVGCGLDNSTIAGTNYIKPGNPDSTHWTNYIRSAEYVQSIMFFISIGLIVLPTCVFSCIFSCIAGYDSGRRSARAEQQSQYQLSQYLEPEDPEPENLALRTNEDSEEGKWAGVLFRAVSIFMILIFAAIEIPLHYVQEAKPRSISVLDSFGPLQWANATTDSWSDCFQLHAPADRNGFLSTWWQTYQKDALIIMGLL